MLRCPRYALATIALTCALATAASAGPKDDLHAALSKFLAQTSFRGDIDGNMAGRSTHSTIEFQAPDRIRVTTQGRPPVVMIGDTMYMNANGHAMKVPMPAGNPMTQYRDASILAQLERGMLVEDLGLDSIDGMPTHKYRYTVEKPQPSTSMIWVSMKSGLPMQVQTSRAVMGKPINTIIRYSKFNDASIKINAPN
jgi:outer membrane lipoprotein-sorting protein